jgi:light-regulated signal transduction histidine kinase (bacteriophytochrome)
MSSNRIDTSEINPLFNSTDELLARIRELEARVHDAIEERDAAYREMSELARFISHDLRAPLRGIDGYSRALMEDYGAKLDAVGIAYLQYISQASRQAAVLIDKLIYFIRVQSAEMNLQTVDLSRLAADLAQNLENLQPGRNITWEIAPNMFLQGDFGMIQELMRNLLENAWKFTAKLASARIEIGQLQSSDGVAYFVRDDGAGFDTKYLGRLFQPFQRLHSSHEFEGAGLGLAIAKRIIQRHHGRIWAEGKVDHGATFYFTVSE